MNHNQELPSLQAGKGLPKTESGQKASPTKLMRSTIKFKMSPYLIGVPA
jgi:hypothetical protein